MMKPYQQKFQRIFCGASQNVMLNPITLTKSKRCYLYVGATFMSFSFSEFFFLIYKTHVALFSVYTSLHPPLQLWVSKILISTQTYFLSGQDLQLFTVQPVSRLFPMSASLYHCFIFDDIEMSHQLSKAKHKESGIKNKSKKQKN